MPRNCFVTELQTKITGLGDISTGEKHEGHKDHEHLLFQSQHLYDCLVYIIFSFYNSK